MINLNRFIATYVTKRQKSMFAADIQQNYVELEKKIKDKSILVIGGAGSIGSSFIRAVLQFQPVELVVVDVNENGLAELTRDLRSTKGMFVPERYVTYPMDFASSVFEKMFRRHGGFDIVANFSAHKHVRSEKDVYSVEALIRNNVLNARKLLDLLCNYPPEVYFCVSTDKAANPVSIMGASKRIMEDVIFSYSDRFPVKTARFANVAFSNGSLPDGFLSRIQKGQPLSAPSDIKRYFVSPEESGQICMLAAILGKNREIFFPKLQEAQMMSFDMIAVSLLQANGYEVLQCDSEQEAIEKAEMLKQGSKQYPVFFTVSNTSGEKPYEEFYTDQENVDLKRLAALGVVIDKETPSRDRIDSLFEKLDGVFQGEDVLKEEIVDTIREYLPWFSHIETGKTLDSKM